MSDPATLQTTISLEELKRLIQDAVHDAICELLDEDANTEPNFRPEFAQRLRRYRTQRPMSVPIDDIHPEAQSNE
jgi:hypothetical protein